jgi:hypothetical protein
LDVAVVEAVLNARESLDALAIPMVLVIIAV